MTIQLYAFDTLHIGPKVELTGGLRWDHFDVDFEGKGMGYLINDGMKPNEAAQAALKADPQFLDGWLANVTTFDGKPGIDAVKAKLGL